MAAIVAKARERRAGDPRPRLGFAIEAEAERERSAGLQRRAAEEPGHEWARDWERNSRIAARAAIELRAIADSLPVPPAPLPGRVHLPHDWGTWRAIEAGHAEPGEYHAHVIEAMREARAAGLFYNADTGPRAAAIMAQRWGYPDAREGAEPRAEWGTVRPFGSHCYSAGSVLRAREAREALREAAAALRCGPLPGRLIFRSGENVTSANIVRISHTGETVEVTGKRGRSEVKATCTAVQCREAIERGQEWARKHARKRATQPAAPDSVLIDAARGRDVQAAPTGQSRRLTPQAERTFATDEADERAAAPVKLGPPTGQSDDSAQSLGPWRVSACRMPEYAPANRPVHVLFTPNRARALGQGGEAAGACVGFYMAGQTYNAIPTSELATPADFERFGPLQAAPSDFLWSPDERAAELRRNAQPTADEARMQAIVNPPHSPAVLALLARVANDRSASAADDRDLTATGLIRTAPDGWLSLTDAGRAALERAGYAWSSRPGFGWILPAELPRLIVATIAARDTALTVRGLAEFGPIPPELADLPAIERAARALVDAGELGMFDYSAQGHPPAFYLPIKREPAPAAEPSASAHRIAAHLIRAAREACNGVPSDATLQREAARLERNAATMAERGAAQMAADYSAAAGMLRELAEPEHAEPAAHRDIDAAAALSRLPIPVGTGDRDAAQTFGPDNWRDWLRIPATDPRARIPGRFARGHLFGR